MQKRTTMGIAASLVAALGLTSLGARGHAWSGPWRGYDKD